MRILTKKKNKIGELGVIDDVLSYNELKTLEYYLEDFTEDLISSNKVGWDARLVKDISGTIDLAVISDLMYEELYSIFAEKASVVFGRTLEPSDIRLNYYSGNNLGGINWHDDGSYKGAMSFYLDDWKKEYGGIFCYTLSTKENYETVVPKRNRLVYQTGGIWHKVTPIEYGSPIRRSIQVWVV